MIDLHSHLLPGIDDGSQDWDETLAMARQAVDSGTTEVVITHHILDNTHYKLESEIVSKFGELQEMLAREGIPLRAHLAAEIFYQLDMKFTSRLSTLNNNGRYFLVEFPMQGIPRGADEIFFKLILEGKIPIIAHPERNLGFLKKPERAYDFVQRGAFLQINAGSLNGSYGEGVKALAIALLNSRLVHFIGSDGHNTRRRPMIIGDVYDVVSECWGETASQKIFYENPRKALAGEDIRVAEPMPVEPVQRPFSFSPINVLRRLVSRVA